MFNNRSGLPSPADSIAGFAIADQFWEAFVISRRGLVGRRDAVDCKCGYGIAQHGCIFLRS